LAFSSSSCVKRLLGHVQIPGLPAVEPRFPRHRTRAGDPRTSPSLVHLPHPSDLLFGELIASPIHPLEGRTLSAHGGKTYWQ
jgi:hypothetical protein